MSRYFPSKFSTHDENKIIEQSFAILSGRLRETTISISSPTLVERYLLHKLILEEREIFGALWLDVKSRLIECEEIALGTLTQAQVFPREILKSALKHNAAKVIFFHNHPTGDVMPSPKDKLMTSEMKQLLKIIGVRLEDHIIVAGTQTRSFVRNGDM